MTDDRIKFGYEHMMEMRAIRAELIAEGVTDFAELHFGAVDRYIDRHRNDKTFRQICDELKAKIIHLPSRVDQYREALQMIADGHNDARALAEQVLAQCK